jgi:molybdopterin synthase catalytic subunit
MTASSLPTIVSITDQPLDLDSLLAQITLPSTGAAAVFSGMVRGETLCPDLHQTAYLEYEAYQPMAEAVLQQIVQEIRRKWPAVQGIAIVQRVGRLYPQTPTILVACTAAHRHSGIFEAARYGIDRVKEILPVWKKEVGPGGEFWVEGDHHVETDGGK